MYTVATVVMHNAVKRHQLGTATGALNLFRVLGGAIVVAAFGAIVIGGAGDAASVMMLGKLAGGHGDFASAFRFVFIAAAVCLAVALACVLAVEERPLHGPVRLADPAAESILVNLPLHVPRNKAGQGIENAPQLHTFSVKGQRLYLLRDCRPMPPADLSSQFRRGAYSATAPPKGAACRTSPASASLVLIAPTHVPMPSPRLGLAGRRFTRPFRRGSPRRA
jgi:hypothetical protein